MVLSLYPGFTKRIVVHMIANFDLNTTANTFSFDICSQNIGVPNIRLGCKIFYFNFESSSLSQPVLSDVNLKYTLSSPS